LDWWKRGDKYGLQAIQDEKHALFLCSCMQMCSLRLQLADQWHTKLLSIRLELFIPPKLVLKMSSIFPETNQWFLSFYFRGYGCFFDGWCSPATWTVKVPGWRSSLNLWTCKAQIHGMFIIDGMVHWKTNEVGREGVEMRTKDCRSSPPLGHPIPMQKWSASSQHHISAHTPPLWMIFLLLACVCLCRRAHAKIIPVGPVGAEKFDRAFFKWGNLTDPAPIAPFGPLFWQNDCTPNPQRGCWKILTRCSGFWEVVVDLAGNCKAEW